MISRYDQWATREPPEYDPPPQPRCGNCGSFLRLEPDSTDLKEQTEHCTGKRQVFVRTWNMRDDADVIGIIGLDKLGKTYEDVHDPLCGQPEGHPEHEAVMHAWTELLRTCRKCRTLNIETVV